MGTSELYVWYAPNRVPLFHGREPDSPPISSPKVPTVQYLQYSAYSTVLTVLLLDI